MKADVLVSVEFLGKGGGTDVAGKGAALEVGRVEVLGQVVITFEGESADDANMLAGGGMDGALVLEEV